MQPPNTNLDPRLLSMDQMISMANVLIDAMPYIRIFRGCTVVVKYGGAAMIDPTLKEAVIRDIVLLHDVGIKVIVVHGGGPEITGLMKRLGLKPQFVDGQRVTDEETLDVATMVLDGKINTELTHAINQQGGRAVGLSGKDARLIVAEKLVNRDEDGAMKGDLGYVGTVKQINPEILEVLREKDFIPVISPLGAGEDGHGYNINADTVALEIARAIRARKLIFLTDTPGVLRDANDPKTVIPTIFEDEIEEMIEKKTVSGGMIPKLRSARYALEICRKVHILDGRVPHSLLLELFTPKGIGTQILRRENA